MGIRGLCVALSLFIVGAATALVGMAQYRDAYTWVAHTSDVRMAVGRAIGHVGGGHPCPETLIDATYIAVLTSDNPGQAASVRALFAEAERACDPGTTAGRVSALSKIDATERSLMVIRRSALARAWTWTGVTFALSIVLGLACLSLSLVSLRQTVGSLEASEEKFRLLASNASDLIRIHDADGSTVYASPSCERILGFTPVEMTSSRALALAHPDDLPMMREVLAKVQKPFAPSVTIRYRLATKQGGYVWFETHTDPVHDASGQLLRFCTIARDITQTIQSELELERLSVTDGLTGLLNRRGFMMLSEQQHRVASRQRLGVAVIFIDMDGLKSINDSLGHEAGDEAIRSLAAVLRSTFRDSDVLARLGGDEFCALAYDVDARGAAAVTDRVLEAIAQAAETRFGNRVRASVGCAVMRPGTVTSLSALMAEADALMYAKKRAGKQSLIASQGAQSRPA